MLSLQKCRLLLGMDCELTDSQVELLREQLYALANVALDAFHQVTETPFDSERQPSEVPVRHRQESDEPVTTNPGAPDAMLRETAEREGND